MSTISMRIAANSQNSSTHEIAGKSPKYVNNVGGKVCRWIHDYPKIAKVSIIAAGILLSPILIPVLSVGLVIGVRQGMKNGHSFADSFKKVVLLGVAIFDFIVPPDHAMSTHVFKEGDCRGCTLKYEGDIPVLNLENAKSPSDAGYVQGYLLGEETRKLLNRWNAVLWLVIPTPKKAEELCTYLKKTIPVSIQEEMEGVVQGFNDRMVELDQKERVTLEEVLLYHILPDILHSGPATLVKKFFPAHGCTAILDTDEKNGPVLGRNMDWPSLGLAGTYSFISKRRCAEKTIMEIATPGMVGTVTGMSSSHFALAMNVCEGETQNKDIGLPACILNRMIIDACASIEDVKAFVEKNRPFGPYHLSVADAKAAQSFHFYQGKDDKDYVRNPGKNAPVVTTNCRYNDKGAYQHYFNSKEREKNIRRHYAASKNKDKLVENALKLPLVNNHETVHHVMMKPGKNKMKLVVDNSYAADRALHSIRL